MRYLKRTEIGTIKDQYEKIIGWGTGPIFQMNYKPLYFDIDFLIDGTGKDVGKEYKGLKIKSESSLQTIQGRVLIIIYAIYESEILEQIKKYDQDNMDVIIYSLLDIKLENGCMVPQYNGKSCEDILLVSLINQLHLETVKYVEVGVCHPIMRNNTYMLYEQYGKTKGYQGVLVEANPTCWPLIEEYRKEDILVKAGITPDYTEGNEKLTFYVFPHWLGHSTFSEELAQEAIHEGHECKKMMVPVKMLNSVLEEYFDETPDILALDAEGLDDKILNSWDSEKYPFKIIISEIMDEDDVAQKLMNERGYRMYARTLENIIWVNEKFNLFV